MNVHSALDPVGSDAATIAELWWWFLGVSTVVYVLVIVALLLAMHRARRHGNLDRPLAKDRRYLMVGGAMAATVLILLALLAGDFALGRSVLGRSSDPQAVHLRVVGQQFWWQLEYDDPRPDRRLVTANELYLPVGRHIELQLQARDVIHSFWLPNVAGKKDLIPGITNSESFVLTRTGRYEGQCAEYCGYQHAKMRTILHAVTAEEFARWKDTQLQPAQPPRTAQQQLGRDVFMRSSCALCHSIRGTDAGGTVGPDLTHVASRDRLAAGIIENSPGPLKSWLRDPQRIKPGVNMPGTPLPADELDALVAYLRNLQ